MQRQSRVTRAVAAAAISGLLAGAVSLTTGCKSNNPDNTAGASASTGTSSDNSMMAKHDCKGQNSCKGQGGCKTGDNGCKGKNSCKGKGGCSTTHPME